jgi:hypothetical protein
MKHLPEQVPANRFDLDTAFARLQNCTRNVVELCIYCSCVLTKKCPAYRIHAKELKRAKRKHEKSRV